MNSIMQDLKALWSDNTRPFLVGPVHELSLRSLQAKNTDHLTRVEAGEVVALIGDFDAQSIADLLVLLERRAIVVPLSGETRADHNYFFQAAQADWVVENGVAARLNHFRGHPLLSELRQRKHPGLVLFSTGTTGRPKAILHDMTVFLIRFSTPRPALRTLAFLRFDHIGGINTLLHTLYNQGVVVSPAERSVAAILALCRQHSVEVLPTTPTFLRLMLLSGLVPDAVPTSVRVITYGTEKMDQPTLDSLCGLLPSVDFRQTYGMSELGIMRVKSKSRNSLYMRIGGEGVEVRIDDNILKIRSQSRMMGYLNAESPFDDEGWYNTNDVVEVCEDYIKVVGRVSDVINVGGLKFMASEVERVALEFPGIALALAEPKDNPITGQHCELTVQTQTGMSIDVQFLKQFLALRLASHMLPRRIRVAQISVNHRFKRS